MRMHAISNSARFSVFILQTLHHVVFLLLLHEWVSPLFSKEPPEAKSMKTKPSHSQSRQWRNLISSPWQICYTLGPHTCWNLLLLISVLSTRKADRLFHYTTLCNCILIDNAYWGQLHNCHPWNKKNPASTVLLEFKGKKYRNGGKLEFLKLDPAFQPAGVQVE